MIRQRESFITLMENYNQVLEAQEIALNSAGIATERYQIYMDSAEAATNRFTATWEKLASEIINSEALIWAIDFGTAILKIVDNVGVLTIAISALLANLGKTAILKGILSLFVQLGGTFAMATTASGALAVSIGGLTVSLVALQAIAGTLVFAAVTLAIYELAKAYKAANKEMTSLNEEFVAQGKEYQDSIAEIDNLKERYKQLSEQAELTNEDILELSNIVSTLKNDYGVAGDAVDLFTDVIDGNTASIRDNIKAIEDARKAKAQEYLDYNKAAYDAAQAWAKTREIYFTGRGGSVPEAFNGTPKEVLDQLRERMLLEEQSDGFYHRKYKSLSDEIDANEKIISQYELNLEVIKEIAGIDTENNDALKTRLGLLRESNLLIESEKSAAAEPFDFLTGMADLGSEIQSATSLYKEYLETQELSTDQIFDIIQNNENWIELLTTENGRVVLNTIALRENAIAKIDNAISSLKLQVVEGQLNTDLLKQIGILEMLRIQVIKDFNEIESARAEEQRAAAEAQVAEIQAKASEIQEQAYQDLLQITINMLRQKKQAEIDALQAQLDSYKAIIDAEKELIQQKEKEREYDKEKAERNKSISNLESELLELQFDDSEEGTAKRLALEEQLAEEKDDLSEFEHDRSIELQEDALDTEYEKYEKIINKKIKKLEQYLEETGTITQDAIALLSNRSDKFYQSLIEWNRQFGSGVDEDIVGAWQRAFNAMVAYAQAAQQLGVGDGITIGDLGDEGTGDQGDLSGERVKINSKDGDMVTGYQTSGGTAVETQLKEGRYYTVAEYKSGAKAAYRIKGYDEDNNAIDTWIKSKNIIFETYHSGLEKGAVGGASNQYGEVFAKLLRGEFVINPQQIKDYVTTIFPKTVKAVASGGAGSVTIGSFMPVNVEGNLDSSVMPDMKDIAKEVQKEFYEFLKKRGIFRNANSYTL